MILALLVSVVSGVVVDETTGAGVRKAEVMLVAGRQAQSAMSDAEGRFRFEGVTPGRYQVQIQKAGFEYREGRGQSSRGWVEVGQSGDQTGLRYVLRPLGLVTGRVVDSDGDPVIGARLMLLRQSRRGGRTVWVPAQGAATVAVSDDRGEFRLFGVQPGKYVLGASGAAWPRSLTSKSNRTGTIPVFLPEALDPEAAQVLDIKAGTRLESLTVKTRTSPLYLISGRVTGLAGEQGMGVHVAVEQASWSAALGMGRGGAVMREGGEFTAGPLPPGTYTLFAQQVKMGPPAEGNRRTPEQLGGVATVTLADRDVEGVVIQLGQGATIEGAVAVDGEKETAAKGLYVMVQSSEESGYAQGGEVKPDGTFQFRVGRPGRYFIRPRANLNDSYLASVKVGGEEALGREIDLAYGSPGAIRVVYRKDGGRVEGTVRTKEEGGFGRSGAAILWPLDAKLRPFPYQAKSDLTAEGTFSFRNVAPGEYLVFATTGIDQRVWIETADLPKEVEEQAVRVKVLAGSSSTVEVPLVPWPEE